MVNSNLCRIKELEIIRNTDELDHSKGHIALTGNSYIDQQIEFKAYFNTIPIPNIETDGFVAVGATEHGNPVLWYGTLKNPLAWDLLPSLAYDLLQELKWLDVGKVILKLVEPHAGSTHVCFYKLIAHLPQRFTFDVRSQYDTINWEHLLQLLTSSYPLPPGNFQISTTLGNPLFVYVSSEQRAMISELPTEPDACLLTATTIHDSGLITDPFKVLLCRKIFKEGIYRSPKVNKRRC